MSTEGLGQAQLLWSADHGYPVMPATAEGISRYLTRSPT